MPDPIFKPLVLNTDFPTRSSTELFSKGGQRLPCWLPNDDDPVDQWLISPEYYPKYHQFFSEFDDGRKLRVLEIGVRTGYMMAVLAAALPKGVLYVGVDPNLYVAEGLELASATGQILRRQGNFDFVLIEGLSEDPTIQRTLKNSGPFDLIHVDGNHSFDGKMRDLQLASCILAPGGAVLVDDFDHHSDIVPPAITQALGEQWFDEARYLKTFRGCAILTKANAESES